MKKKYIVPQTEVTKVMMSQIIALSTTETAASYDENDFLDNEVKEDRGGWGDEW